MSDFPSLVVMNLSAILVGAAILITAIGTFLNTWVSFRTKSAVAAVDKKVDDGAKETRQALTEIAKTAVQATLNRTVRSTDLPPAPDLQVPPDPPRGPR